jgi:DNA modification methylase
VNEIWNEDCVRGMPDRLEPESVDLTVTSIPFGALFMYSGKTEDIGNNQDGTDFVRSMFGLHLRFFCEQLFGVTRPGTNACIHIQQLVSYRIEHGYMGRRDFRGAVVDVFEQAGFEWKGEVTIPKNPQVIAQRQKLHSLLFVTGRRDARQLAPAVNDHLLIFQRPGEAPPVKALQHEENPDGWVTGTEWIKWAHGTWDDIRETDVLEGWKHGRDDDDEKHVCPLQLEVIRRCVKLYSNPGELVLDPFMGIGSTAFVAAQERRAFAGFELKDSYHRLAVRNASRALQSGDEAQLAIEVA